MNLKSNIFKHRRLLKLCLSAITIVGAVFTTQIGTAETVMEKVARTGVLTAGTSKDAFPFAYADNNENLTGYSVDILRLIQQQIETELGRKIKLKLVAIEPQARITQLTDRKVDIVCDASSFTWERDRQIDFSVSYGITGTRLLVKQNNYDAISQSLVNKKIGVLPGTTNELAIKKAEPNAKIVYMSDRDEGHSALEMGTIDAFADDDILLNSWLQNTSNGEDFNLVGYYSQEGIACMIPENNSQFLNNVNYALVSFMQGFIDSRPNAIALFDKWFGYNGKVPLTRDLRALMLENMQLVIDFREEISSE